MPKVYQFGWQDVEFYVEQVCLKYAQENLPGVYGIPRGGTVLAVLISHMLDIPLLMAPVKGCLIVDDICDSGESLLHYQRNSSSLNKPDYHISVMVYKKNALVTPEFYIYEKTDAWIVFPWEKKEE